MKIKELSRIIPMNNSIFFLIILIFSPSFSYADDNYQQFLNKYDQLLAEHTKPTSKNGISYTGVNYNSWSKDIRHKEALKLFNSINTNEVKDKKAFWINAYNFLTIELIIREGEKESIKNLATKNQSAWKRFSWELNGKSYTLDSIEHEILRPLGDPSIHFAINCASVSCPDVRNESYRSETLDTQLKEQIELALNNKKKGYKNEGSTVYIHKLFEWFALDFDNGNVKGWLSKYTDISRNAKLKYLDYDWSLNDI